MDANRRQARSRLANASKAARRNASADSAAEVTDARRDYAAAALADYIRTMVDEWPPLTPDQVAYLRDLLSPRRSYFGR